MSKFLRIKEWATYQHYKDRNPPWIKLHRSVLNSFTWVSLDDASRLLAIACMLLAAETDNKIPLDRDYLQRMARLKQRPDIRPLIDVGFAEVFDDQQVMDESRSALAAASTLQANRTTETEAETDTKKNKRAYRLPEDFIPKPAHYSLAKEVGVIVDVEFPKFRDYFLGNGFTKIDWDRTFNNWLRNSVHFRGGNGKNRPNTQIERQPSAQVARYQSNLAAILHDRTTPPIRSAGVGNSNVSTSAEQKARSAPRDSAVVEGEIK